MINLELLWTEILKSQYLYHVQQKRNSAKPVHLPGTKEHYRATFIIKNQGMSASLVCISFFQKTKKLYDTYNLPAADCVDELGSAWCPPAPVCVCARARACVHIGHVRPSLLSSRSCVRA